MRAKARSALKIHQIRQVGIFPARGNHLPHIDLEGLPGVGVIQRKVKTVFTQNQAGNVVRGKHHDRASLVTAVRKFP